ncbi:putative 60s ribosomal protein l6 [Erysiphe necator]|uniref:Putative 60s ribosomal protein l6 n=1 Tax=Uncinula necator TaxID=52586 RepID=A0A0B1P8R6_UNCNE|nr:putative 60s ribosomal protein l6 [Erysiphe necator]
MRMTKASLRNFVISGQKFLNVNDSLILNSTNGRFRPTLVSSTHCIFHFYSFFSTSSTRTSYVGRAPISVPPEVKFVLIPPTKNAQSTASHEAAHAKAEIEGPLGTMRAYLNNYILGVSEGHTAILRLVGVGYRATIETTATTVTPEFQGQQFVSLKVGYSHPIELPVPRNVKASVPQPTRILLQGPDKEIVSQLAAKIRMWRKPEPYKGKGIFVNGETIKLKSKKIK